MNVLVVIDELWMHLKIFVQLLGLLLLPDDDDAIQTSLRLNSEWARPWGSENWIASVTCRIYLPINYTPHERQKGFYMKLVMENHATHIEEVYYPFDSSVQVSGLNGPREFMIRTGSNIWEYSGWKNYEIHVGFNNKGLTVAGNWPRGTCFGPFSFG